MQVVANDVLYTVQYMYNGLTEEPPPPSKD
jgi:hypothetical protein